MKFALSAIIITIVFSGCANQLYTHRSDFQNIKREGEWNKAYKARIEGTDKLESDPGRRPLFGTRHP